MVETLRSRFHQTTTFLPRSSYMVRVLGKLRLSFLCFLVDHLIFVNAGTSQVAMQPLASILVNLSSNTITSCGKQSKLFLERLPLQHPAATQNTMICHFCKMVRFNFARTRLGLVTSRSGTTEGKYFGRLR